jgi:hypothetical protein
MRLLERCDELWTLPEIGYRFANPERVLVGTGRSLGRAPDWPHGLLDPLMFESSVDYHLDTHEDMIEQELLKPGEVHVPDASVDALVVCRSSTTATIRSRPRPRSSASRPVSSRSEE